MKPSIIPLRGIIPTAQIAYGHVAVDYHTLKDNSENLADMPSNCLVACVLSFVVFSNVCQTVFNFSILFWKMFQRFSITPLTASLLFLASSAGRLVKASQTLDSRFLLIVGPV